VAELNPEVKTHAKRSREALSVRDGCLQLSSPSVDFDDVQFFYMEPGSFSLTANFLTLHNSFILL
jgi:hypothetical protein